MKTHDATLQGNEARRIKRLALAASAALVLSITACGGASTATAELPTSMDDLVKQATTEGQVSWSSPKPLEQMQPAIDLFEKKYPGIKVNYASTLAPEQVNKLKAEQAARKVTIDVANAGGLTIIPSDGLAADIDWSAYGIENGEVLHEKFVYVWAVPKVWTYNTNRVTESELPKTWDDLLKPEWAGGALSADSAAAFMSVWYSDPSLGTDKAVAWAEKFKQQNPHIATGVNQTHSLVNSGQVKLGTSLANLVLEGAAKGQPVKIAPVSPTTANEAYLYVPKGAPHPAAAVLLTSFLVSDEAQSVLAKTHNSQIPTSTDCSNADQNEVVKALCDAGVEWYPSGSYEQYKGLAEFFTATTKALGTSLE